MQKVLNSVPTINRRHIFINYNCPHKNEIIFIGIVKYIKGTFNQICNLYRIK